MEDRRDIGKSGDGFERDFLEVFVEILKKVVFNHVVFIFIQVMNLKVHKAAAAVAVRTGKSTLADGAVAPAEGEDFARTNIVKANAARRAYDSPLFIHLHVSNAGNNSGGSQRKTVFLVAVHLLVKVVRLAYRVEEALFRRALQGDADLIRHQEIRPVFGYGFGHAGSQLGAVDVLQAVKNAVVVEAADTALVPLIPEVNQLVPIRGDGGIAEFFEFFDNIQMGYLIVLPSGVSDTGDGHPVLPDSGNSPRVRRETVSEKCKVELGI